MSKLFSPISIGGLTLTHRVVMAPLTRSRANLPRDVPNDLMLDKRTDGYGGSIANRARLLLEIVDAIISVWGVDRVAVRMGPDGKWNGMSDSDPKALFTYVATRLNRFGLAYLHVIEPSVMGNVVVVEGQGPVATEYLRTVYTGKIIAAGGFEPDTAETIVAKGDADLVAFGRYFVSNPDLPMRIKQRWPLSAYDRDTFYTLDARGYIDYPAYTASALASPSAEVAGR